MFPTIRTLRVSSSASSVIACRNRDARPWPCLRLFSHSNLQPVKATCRSITQALISWKICIIHGTRRGCRVQYPAEVDRRTLPEPTARRSTTWKLAATRICMLDVELGLDGVHPGALAPGSFEISKWINFIDRAAFDRDARRDNINFPALGGGGGLANFRCRWNAQREISQTRSCNKRQVLKESVIRRVRKFPLSFRVCTIRFCYLFWSRRNATNDNASQIMVLLNCYLYDLARKNAIYSYFRESRCSFLCILYTATRIVQFPFASFHHERFRLVVYFCESRMKRATRSRK